MGNLQKPAEIIEDVDETLQAARSEKPLHQAQGKLISLGTSKKGWADQLLEECQAKQLGIYLVPRKRLDAFIERYLTRCKKFNKPTTIDDKEPP
jgi:hypothetical protein